MVEPSIMLDRAILAMVAKLLDKASDEFHNHGCNDMFIDATPENIEFVKGMIAKSDDPDRAPQIIPEGTKPMPFSGDMSGKILIMDACVMDYCVKCIKEALNF